MSKLQCYLSICRSIPDSVSYTSMCIRTTGIGHEEDDFASLACDIKGGPSCALITMFIATTAATTAATAARGAAATTARAELLTHQPQSRVYYTCIFNYVSLALYFLENPWRNYTFPPW